METQWHGDFDTYGSFCITIPLPQTAEIFTKLFASNEDWDIRAKSDPQALRNLDVRQAIFVPHIV